MSVFAGEIVTVPFFINATDLAAGTPQNVVAPMTGYIAEASGVVQVLSAGAANITFAVGTTAVDGLVLTIPDASAVGTVVTDTPTSKHASRAVTKGDRIQIVPGAAFTGGAVNGYLTIKSADPDNVMPF